MTDAWQEMDDWCAIQNMGVDQIDNFRVSLGAPVVHFLPCVGHAASNASRRNVSTGTPVQAPHSAKARFV